MITKKKKRWRKIVSVMAAIVVFITTYALILPAVTLEVPPDCGLEEHTHTDECRSADGALICGKQEHVHTEACSELAHRFSSDLLLSEVLRKEAAEKEEAAAMEAHTQSQTVTKTEEKYGETSITYFTNTEKTTPTITKGVYTETSGEHPASPVREAPEPAAEIAAEPVAEEPVEIAEEPVTETPTEAVEDTPAEDIIEPVEEIPAEAVEEAPVEVVEETPIEAPTETAEEPATETPVEVLTEAPEEVPASPAPAAPEAAAPASAEAPEAAAPAVAVGAPLKHQDEAVPPIYGEDHIDLSPYIDNANLWQVLKGLYTGNDATDKQMIINSTDHPDLRVQKSIVPAGTENEFYIYLSVEPIINHDWKDVVGFSGLLLANNNKTQTLKETQAFSLVEAVDGLTTLAQIKTALGLGNSKIYSLMLPRSYPMDSTTTDKVGNNVQINTMILRADSTTQESITPMPGDIVVNDVNLWYSLPQGSKGSFTLVYSPTGSDGSWQVSTLYKDGDTVVVPRDAYGRFTTEMSDNFRFVTQKTTPTLVTDVMGDHVEVLEVVTPKYGTATVSGNTLTWDLTTGTLPTELPNDPSAYEYYGVIEDGLHRDDDYILKNEYQLVYKVRLKTEDTGFNSTAQHMGDGDDTYKNLTNGATTVTYNSTESTDPKTASITSPEVRGLLYDVSFKKVDDNGDPLKDVVFNLVGERKSAEVKTGSDGTVNLTGLPCGTYTLTETVPSGMYSPDGGVWSFTLCYTTDGAVLTVNGNDMRYTGNDDTSGTWKIVNTSAPPYGPPLPNTGGPGTRWFTIGGLSILAVSLCGFALSRKRKRRSV